MDAFQMELVTRLPLAQAVPGLFDYSLDEPFLDEVFQEHRGRCYPDVLTFATLVQVLRVHDGSERKSIQAGHRHATNC